MNSSSSAPSDGGLLYWMQGWKVFLTQRSFKTHMVSCFAAILSHAASGTTQPSQHAQGSQHTPQHTAQSINCAGIPMTR